MEDGQQLHRYANNFSREKLLEQSSLTSTLKSIKCALIGETSWSRDRQQNTVVIHSYEQKPTRLMAGSDRSEGPDSLHAGLAKPNKHCDMTKYVHSSGEFYEIWIKVF